MQKIKETAGEFLDIMNQWDSMPEDNKEAIRQKKIEQEPMIFVVIETSEQKWDNFYQRGSWCNLGRDSGKVRAGGVMAHRNFVPQADPFPREMTEQEQFNYQIWCEANSIYPRPMAKLQKEN